ncbi:hypothetical protein [Epilithonimonas vandammei]|uniref:DUF2691 family protein n=1 Tax=Epilithonimonas vandammei TaxID=2487072 RepID=A0A3G8Y3I5_9FLAO|nr:hypothetical protein [Epilithonimonas vandammei]AZI39630.1 hypothetical protein EIB74_06490 [Epilithonimonas vandammei]
MNWVIKHSKKIKYHTDLKEILKPIWSELLDYKWIITDVEFLTDSQIPLNYDTDYFFLDKNEFESLMISDTQIVWGIIAAVKNDYEIRTENIIKLSCESDEVWKENTFLIPQSIVEIIAFDSGYTILKFKEKNLSEKFKHYFEEAIELQKFSQGFRIN